MDTNFCNCPKTECPQHPNNHREGCSLCIKDNINKKKIPTCMFKAINDDTSTVKDLTFKGFVDFFLEHESKQ